MVRLKRKLIYQPLEKRKSQQIVSEMGGLDSGSHSIAIVNPGSGIITVDGSIITD